MDNWLLDYGARPPRYHQDALVDLTLTVHDLIDVPSQSLNVNLVRQIIAYEDVELVLNTKFDLSKSDSLVWGFSRNGRYDSRSGYKLNEDLAEFQDGLLLLNLSSVLGASLLRLHVMSVAKALRQYAICYFTVRMPRRFGVRLYFLPLMQDGLTTRSS